ncbi:MAG: LamG domain-containing protein [Kofleriaceae bacterium]
MWKSALFVLAGCRQVFGLDDPTALKQDAFVQHDANRVADVRSPDAPSSLDTGLVFNYPLDAVTQNQIVDQIHGYNLSCNNCPIAVPSPHTDALEFSTSENANGMLGHTATIAPPFTLAVWIDIEHQPSSGMTGVAVATQSFSIAYTTQKLALQFNNNVNPGDIGAYPVGGWQHVAITFDGLMFQIFLGGVASGAISPADGSITLTSLALASGMDTKGIVALDELRGYNRILTADEISLLAGTH